MDSKLMLEVTDCIEGHPKMFDQSSYGWPSDLCGSPCCVAGVIGIIRGKAKYKLVKQFAMEQLGITHIEAGVLFCPTWPRKWWKGGWGEDGYRVPSAAAAVVILRNMAEGGVVWPDNYCKGEEGV